MKNFIIILALIVPQFAYLQTGPGIKWQRALGGTGADFAFTIAPTTDGGFILGNNVRSINGDVIGNHGGSDFWVVKFDAQKNIQWQRALGSSKFDEGTLVKPTSDGGYMVAGNVVSGNGDVKKNTYKGGESDIWLVKLSATGSMLWQKTLGGSNKDKLIALEEMPGGGYIVAGNSNSTNGDIQGNHGLLDMWVCRISATGTLLWQRALGGSGDDELTDMLLAKNGNIIVAGVTWSVVSGDIDVSYGGRDLWIGIINANGQLIWKKTIGGSNGEQNLTLRSSSDGNYFYFSGVGSSIDGEFSGSHGNSDIIVYKIGLSGEIAWKKLVGGTGTEDLWAMQATADGGCVVGGNGYSSDGDFAGASGGHMIVAKLNSSGDVEWAKRYGGSNQDFLYYLSQTKDEGFIFYGSVNSGGGDISGFHPGTKGWEQDIWVVKLNKSGSIIWQRCYGGSGYDWWGAGYSLLSDFFYCSPQSITENQIQFPDGSYYFVATSNSKDGDVQGVHLPRQGGTVLEDIWVVQIPADGLINQQTSATPGMLPEEDRISAYPNPFVNSTTIRFRAWETAKLDVDLYDLTGRKIKTIFTGSVVAGQRYNATLKEAGLPKGNYIFVITNGKRKESGRLMKLD